MVFCNNFSDFVPQDFEIVAVLHLGVFLLLRQHWDNLVFELLVNFRSLAFELTSKRFLKIIEQFFVFQRIPVHASLLEIVVEGPLDILRVYDRCVVFHIQALLYEIESGENDLRVLGVTSWDDPEPNNLHFMDFLNVFEFVLGHLLWVLDLLWSSEKSGELGLGAQVLVVARGILHHRG